MVIYCVISSIYMYIIFTSKVFFHFQVSHNCADSVPRYTISGDLFHVLPWPLDRIGSQPSSTSHGDGGIVEIFQEINIIEADIG